MCIWCRKSVWCESWRNISACQMWYIIPGDLSLNDAQHNPNILPLKIPLSFTFITQGPDYSRHMITSSNGSIFHVAGHLCGEFTGPRWIPAQRPVTRSFDVFFDMIPNQPLSKNREAGDLRRHRAHNYVTVMTLVNVIAVIDALPPSVAYRLCGMEMCLSSWNPTGLIYFCIEKLYI